MHSIQRALTTWSQLPGNWDTLHYQDLFESDNVYGIPAIARQEHAVPAQLLQWGSRPALLKVKPRERAAVHFFLDDYRFESLWKNPERNLDALLRVGCVLSPDFSLWRDMPLAMQIWQTYRNRWLGAYWQQQGLQVIPTLTWSEPYDFCYAGIERGAMVAISTVGVIKDKEAHSLFRAGFEKMIEAIQPATILCYGSLAGLVDTDIPVISYATRWQRETTPQPAPKQAKIIPIYKPPTRATQLPLWQAG